MIYLVSTQKKSHVLLKEFKEIDLVYAQICRDRYESKAIKYFSDESFYLIRAISRDHLFDLAPQIRD